MERDLVELESRAHLKVFAQIHSEDVPALFDETLPVYLESEWQDLEARSDGIRQFCKNMKAGGGCASANFSPSCTGNTACHSAFEHRIIRLEREKCVSSFLVFPADLDRQTWAVRPSGGNYEADSLGGFDGVRAGVSKRICGQY
jgi:hypothetical protein